MIYVNVYDRYVCAYFYFQFKFGDFNMYYSIKKIFNVILEYKNYIKDLRFGFLVCYFL